MTKMVFVLVTVLGLVGCGGVQKPQPTAREPHKSSSQIVAKKGESTPKPKMEERHLERLDRTGDGQVVKLYNLPIFKGDPQTVPIGTPDGEIICAPSDILHGYRWTERELWKPVGAIVYRDGGVWVIFNAVHKDTCSKYLVACRTHDDAGEIVVEQNRCCVSPSVYHAK